MVVISERVNLNTKDIGITLYAFAVLNMFWLILQWYNVDPIFTNVFVNNMPQVDHVGFLGARFALGAFAALICPFVYRVNKFLPITLAPLFYFAKSSTALGAFCLAYSFLLIADFVIYFGLNNFRFKKYLKLACVLIPALAAIGVAFWYTFFVDMPTGQFMKRLEVWSAGIQVLKTNPWFGFGLGGWAATKFVGIQGNGQPEMWLWPHNEFLGYLYEAGVLGCIFLYAYFKNFFKKVSYKTLDQRVMFASFISLAIIAAFHFPMHARFCGMSVFILALMEAHTTQQEVKNEKTISPPITAGMY